jgi:heme-degrading monooxygenase HmoA
MVEVFHRYRVHPSQARAFEHAYGPTGPWAKLYGSHPGFRRLRLFRHRDDASIYLTIAVWEHKADWDAFRSDHASECRRLERQLRLLYLEEHLLGYYEGPEEYRAPLDETA